MVNQKLFVPSANVMNLNVLGWKILMQTVRISSEILAITPRTSQKLIFAILTATAVWRMNVTSGTITNV